MQVDEPRIDERAADVDLVVGRDSCGRALAALGYRGHRPVICKPHPSGKGKVLLTWLHRCHRPCQH